MRGGGIWSTVLDGVGTSKQAELMEKKNPHFYKSFANFSNILPS